MAFNVITAVVLTYCSVGWGLGLILVFRITKKPVVDKMPKQLIITQDNTFPSAFGRFQPD